MKDNKGYTDIVSDGGMDPRDRIQISAMVAPRTKNINDLISDSIGSCSCMTKTPDFNLHSDDCKYKSIELAKLNVKMTVDWEHETNDPIAEMDAIYEVYKKTMGKSAPDNESAIALEKTKEMLLTWWGWHREKIRSSLSQPAAVEPAKQGNKDDSHEIIKLLAEIVQLPTNEYSKVDIDRYIEREQVMTRCIKIKEALYRYIKSAAPSPDVAEEQDALYSADQISDACMMAEISDGHCEALLIQLQSAAGAQPDAGEKA